MRELKTTGIYVRVSTSEQRHESQLEELKSYCTQRGWASLTYYIETESGGKVSRPVLDRMMTDVRRGRVERVITYKLDRLGRSLTHLALIIDELSRRGVALICSTQGIDTTADNPAGRLQLGVLMAVAEFERSLIRERVNAGLKAARARGVKLGRPQTLGSRAAEVVALRAAGKGIRAIGRALRMPPSSVSKILRCPE